MSAEAWALQNDGLFAGVPTRQTTWEAVLLCGKSVKG